MPLNEPVAGTEARKTSIPDLDTRKSAIFLHPVSLGARCLDAGRVRPHSTMKNTINLHSSPRCLIARCLLLGVASVVTSQAAVTINSSFNLESGTNLYTYSYSIENMGPTDLALVSIPTSAAANIAGVLTPTGFLLIFDSFQGFISLVEDNDLFTDQTFASGSTVSPFQFTSALAPGTVTFTAFDVEGNEFTGSAVAPIPEPSSLLLLGLALLPISASRRR
jgi:PEP-CTERM motif